MEGTTNMIDTIKAEQHGLGSARNPITKQMIK
jgi:hypothetical protein